MSTARGAEPFTLAVLPDTQYYSAVQNGGLAAMFSAQTQWVADHVASDRVAFVSHVGDTPLRHRRLASQLQ